MSSVSSVIIDQEWITVVTVATASADERTAQNQRGTVESDEETMNASDVTERYKVSIPAQSSGDWRIEKFTVSEDESKFDQFRAAIHGSRRYTPPGTYTRLMRRMTVVMSDTPDEIRDHLDAIRRARGKCLINGLGLGVVLGAMLEKPEVEHVTVIELSQDVIKMVEPFYRDIYGERFTVINADATEYKPPRGSHFDVVWHDIWDNICTDNLDDMKRLHRVYARCTDWQGSWGRAETLRYN